MPRFVLLLVLVCLALFGAGNRAEARVSAGQKTASGVFANPPPGHVGENEPQANEPHRVDAVVYGKTASGRGNFLSPDPFGHASDMSLYAFAHGDPVNSFDPDGRLATRNGINPYHGQWRDGFGVDLWGNFYGVAEGFGPPSGLTARLLEGGQLRDNRGDIADAYGRWQGAVDADAFGQRMVTFGAYLLVRAEGDFGPAGSLGLIGAVGPSPGRGNVALKLGSFSIRDWNGYPASIPKPAGPFRLLGGAEYNAARAEANAANRALHAADESLGGWQIHEVKPVKFSGSPTDIGNKIPLPAGAHSEVTNWWNTLMRDLTRNPGGG